MTDMPDIIKIANFQLNSRIYNASGCYCTSKEELIDLYKCNYTGAVVTKSCTLEHRDGNQKPRYYAQYTTDNPRWDCRNTDHIKKPDLSINSTGLANYGIKYYLDVAREIYVESSSVNDSPLYGIRKPFIISVAGLSFDDNLQLINIINENHGYYGVESDNDTSDSDSTVDALNKNRNKSGVDMIELNLSCPNIPGKAQIGYDPDLVDHLLYRIFNDFKPNIPLGLKLPPYLDPAHVKEIFTVIIRYPVSFITCCNSLGNGLVFDPMTDSPAIVPKNGLGGIGGQPIKPISLSNVYQFVTLLTEVCSTIDVIGCGGVQEGRDVYEYLLVGASAVQIGTQLCEEGLNCFRRVYKEYISEHSKSILRKAAIDYHLTYKEQPQ